MMGIMPLRPSPARQEVAQAPRKIVAAMRIDGLKQAQRNPDIHGQNVEVPGDGAPEDGRADRGYAEKHDFDRRGVLGGEAEWCGVLVVDFVDVLVEGTPVEGSVEPVVAGVFHDEEYGDLEGHC